MRLKKTIVVFCIICLVVSIFAGCSNEDSTKDMQSVEQTTSPAEQTTQPAEQEAKVDSEEVEQELNLEESYTYTMNVMAPQAYDESTRYDFITEKFNVSFDFIPVTWSDWTQKIRIWVASGQLPDILWWDLKIGNSNEYRNWASNGAFKPLPELDDKYPNLQAQLDNMKSDEYLTVNGNLYVIPASRGTNEIDNIGGQMFYYREDWAEELGMTKDEYSWEDAIELAKAFVEQDPGDNGQGNTIGMAFIGWAFPAAAGLQQISPYWDGYVIQDGEYKWGAALPETLEGIKMVKRLMDEGVIWSDQILSSTNDGKNKFFASQVGMYYDGWSAPSKIVAAMNAIKESDPDANMTKTVVPFIVKSPDDTVFAYQTEDFWTVSAFSPKMSDEKFERLIYIYDWGVSDDGKYTGANGIKGIDWDYNDDGSINYMWPTDENGNSQVPYNGSTWCLWNAISETLYYPCTQPIYSDVIRDYYNSAMDRFLEEDVTIKKLDYDVSTFYSENYNKYGTFSTEVRDKIIELLGSSDNIEEDWNEFIDSMQPKVGAVLNELNIGLLKK